MTKRLQAQARLKPTPQSCCDKETSKATEKERNPRCERLFQTGSIRLLDLPFMDGDEITSLHSELRQVDERPLNTY